MRNPPWTRDELIVTLQFYLAHTPTIPGKNSEDILELSQFLNLLQVKLGGAVPEKFRNPNGVYMKLMNFRRFDPEYQGQGLSRGNKDELLVWNRFAPEREELLKVCDAIRNLVSSDQALPPVEEALTDEEEGEEGTGAYQAPPVQGTGYLFGQTQKATHTQGAAVSDLRGM